MRDDIQRVKKILRALNGSQFKPIVGLVADVASSVLFNNTNNSGLTTGMNSAYDAVSSSLMSFSPVGTILGGAMKIGGFVGDGLSAMGIKTDLMTTTDKILDSKFLKLSPVGLVNSIWALKTLGFSADNNTIELVGGSYGGAVKDINDAASKAKKKYGLFSQGAMNKANNLIDLAKDLQSIMTNIANNTSDRRSSISQLNHLNYSMNLNGGYDLKYMRLDGGKLLRIKQLKFFKIGGLIKETINLENKWVPIITEPIELHEDGGKLWTPEIVKLFEEGGKTKKEPEVTILKNVIPEGALHARKHHMENAEGFTEKGIPVIDDDKELQAEIELNEIIFTLEVTLQLEKLEKDGSNKAAIEAGKLLVELILFNTDDRTALIDSLEHGGIITNE